ncbi:sulfatase [Zobellia sp. OII3]|uniref:sulfatase family protein n=1 Tax=Zobellia sp. OII3 TaxID=2034520 RepID=UPI000B5364AA|nr:sulfatase [Zobellia sp. OII3]OWW26176.1 sulfatase [Zobellia sp. OII3]
MKKTIPIAISLTIFICTFVNGQTDTKKKDRRPNILLAISDDQSFFHTSFAGSSFVNTPGFDRIAREGIYFTHCYAGSPGCGPSRSALITGRHHWQNEQSGQHGSPWVKKYVPFIDELEANGYSIGRTGKGVEPFRYAKDKKESLWRKTNAAGIEHSEIRFSETSGLPSTDGISDLDYFANFEYFLKNVRKDEPFFFWYGGHEPHRKFEKGSWKRMGKKLSDVKVPEFLPDTEEIRGDLLDYAVEIEWFDQQLVKMLNYLESIGELENTIVIVTSDNGMDFPKAKANSYEFGAHVPLAVRYPEKFGTGKKMNDLVGFIDFAPTILEVTKTIPKKMLPISGKSLLGILQSKKNGLVDASRKYSFTGRERHTSARYKNWGYPQRAIFSKDYALIWNMKPDRWPAGAPQRYDPKDSTSLLPLFGLNKNGRYISYGAFTDAVEGPTKTYIIENYNNESIASYFALAFAKRPEFELYHISEDASCTKNLYGGPEHERVQKRLMARLNEELEVSKDPRVVGPDKEIFDSYKRYMIMRQFPKPERSSEELQKGIKN